MLLADESPEQIESLARLVYAADLFEPVHWPVETCGLVLKAARRGRLAAKDIESALAQAMGLIALADVAPTSNIGAVVALARSSHISVYDAAYLELALRTGCPLLTSDKALRAAASNANAELVPIQ